MVIGGGISGMAAAEVSPCRATKRISSKRATSWAGRPTIFSRRSKATSSRKNCRHDREIEKNEKIHVHLNTSLEAVDGFVGNFKSTLSENGDKQELEHGIAVIATGGKAYKPEEYRTETIPEF
jgi:heterodisulfide reductase subunit A2